MLEILKQNRTDANELSVVVVLLIAGGRHVVRVVRVLAIDLKDEIVRRVVVRAVVRAVIRAVVLLEVHVTLIVVHHVSKELDVVRQEESLKEAGFLYRVM